MAKTLKRMIARLEARDKGYKAMVVRLTPEQAKGFHRPGSMRKKGH